MQFGACFGNQHESHLTPPKAYTQTRTDTDTCTRTLTRTLMRTDMLVCFDMSVVSACRPHSSGASVSRHVQQQRQQRQLQRAVGLPLEGWTSVSMRMLMLTLSMRMLMGRRVTTVKMVVVMASRRLRVRRRLTRTQSKRRS